MPSNTLIDPPDPDADESKSVTDAPERRETGAASAREHCSDDAAGPSAPQAADRSQSLTEAERDVQQVTAHYERIIAEKERAYRELADSLESPRTRRSEPTALQRFGRRLRKWLVRR